MKVYIDTWELMLQEICTETKQSMLQSLDNMAARQSNDSSKQKN